MKSRVLNENLTAARFLDGVSGNLFLFGFITSKLRVVPNVLVSGLVSFLALLAFLFGYIAWLFASLLFPDQKRKKEHWYGFAQFREQFGVASLIGMVAMIICLVYPPLFVLTAWLFTGSNIIWCIGEFHKLNNPPRYDDSFFPEKQKNYLRYAFLLTIVSCLTAVAATIIFFCPPLTTFTMLIATIVTTALTLAAFYYWGMSLCHHLLVEKKPTSLAIEDTESPKQTASPKPNVQNNTDNSPKDSYSLPFLSILRNSRPNASPAEVQASPAPEAPSPKAGR